MNIVVEQINSITVVSLQGKLNTEACPSVETAINELPAGGKILFDLSKLEYVASAGLRLFLLAAKSSKKTNGRLVVSGLTSNVAQIFKLSGFATFLQIEQDRSKGLGALGG